MEFLERLELWLDGKAVASARDIQIFTWAIIILAILLFAVIIATCLYSWQQDRRIKRLENLIETRNQGPAK